MKRKITILTGAGISAESGVKTFRDSKDGLWEEYKVEDVATPEALVNNTESFLKFYNMRKEQMKTVIPNLAHSLIKDLEEFFDVTVVTTNVDDLHEKAGSSNVIHLHGTLSKLRSSYNPSFTYDYIEDVKVGDVCPDGAQMRPAVVLFGEALPEKEYLDSLIAFEEADMVIIIGTSMQVYPAAGLPWTAKENALIYYIDPSEINFTIPSERISLFAHIQDKATSGMEELFDELLEIFL